MTSHPHPSDPIDRLATLLRAEGTGEDFFADLEAEADALGEDARAYCRTITTPPSTRIFENIYATENAQVHAEQEWFTEYQEGFVTEEVAR